MAQMHHHGNEPFGRVDEGGTRCCVHHTEWVLSLRMQTTRQVEVQGIKEMKTVT